jgi:hypothetical protein
MSKDTVTREQIESWAKLAGIEFLTEKGLERLGDFAIFARQAAHANGFVDLLREASNLIEYATYHDGRYEQMRGANWQSEAQRLVPRMAEALGRNPYESIGK